MILEDKNIEYKAEIPRKNNSLKAEIISFLNTEGGTIYLGVDNEGNILDEKIQFYPQWEELISNWITNAFSVNLNNFITLYPNEKPFKIEIKKGINKPYYYKDGEGFNSKGIYIRVGSTKRVASYDEIRRMLLSSKSHKYEMLESEITDLKFDYLEKNLKKKD